MRPPPFAMLAFGAGILTHAALFEGPGKWPIVVAGALGALAGIAVGVLEVVYWRAIRRQQDALHEAAFQVWRTEAEYWRARAEGAQTRRG